jgi:thiol peroxidase
MERTGIITFKGNPLTLIGEEVKVGGAAPNFTVLKNDLSPVSLSDFAGKTLIISAVPSLVTPVCDTETRKFNKIARNWARTSSFSPSAWICFRSG